VYHAPGSAMKKILITGARETWAGHLAAESSPGATPCGLSDIRPVADLSPEEEFIRGDCRGTCATCCA